MSASYRSPGVTSGCITDSLHHPRDKTILQPVRRLHGARPRPARSNQTPGSPRACPLHHLSGHDTTPRAHSKAARDDTATHPCPPSIYHPHHQSSSRTTTISIDLPLLQFFPCSRTESERERAPHRRQLARGVDRIHGSEGGFGSGGGGGGGGGRGGRRLRGGPGRVLGQAGGSRDVPDVRAGPGGGADAGLLRGAQDGAADQPQVPVRARQGQGRPQPGAQAQRVQGAGPPRRLQRPSQHLRLPQASEPGAQLRGRAGVRGLRQAGGSARQHPGGGGPEERRRARAAVVGSGRGRW